jgi:hypothetical protein
MKHFNLKTLVFCCVASVFFVGCGPDPCKPKFDCGANGTCLEGLCTCSDGYEGEKCDTLSFQKFIGRWKGQEIYYYDLYNDTIAVDWTILRVANAGKLVMVMSPNRQEILLQLVKNNQLQPQNPSPFDSLHIVTTGKATINTAKTQINYQFDYKQIGTNPAFYGKGVLVKQ